jgi:hypothetical protein
MAGPEMKRFVTLITGSLHHNWGYFTEKCEAALADAL